MSDYVLVRKVSREKKLPGTKQQPKYLGPYKILKITKSHLLISPKDGKRKKNIPIHLAKKYTLRDLQGIFPLNA